MAQVETVHTAFPHIPLPNTIYHLSKSRSPQATSEEILERGFLPAVSPPRPVSPLLAPSHAGLGLG